MEKLFLRNTAIKTAQFTSHILGKEIFKHIILFLARVGQIDLLTFAYNRMGILNSENDVVSGESFVINDILKKEFVEKNHVVLFDVGANVGDYAENLLKEFPKAKIFAFEPTPTAYSLLKKKLLNSSVKIFNIGFSSEKTIKKIYSYTQDAGSQHSSMFAEVFTKIHHTESVKEIDFNCTTIDDFCSENEIDFIDFIKIDTEGNELNILKGATKMLRENKINFIQFEFNEMNIFSRVFLKDFYDTLNQYEFYRLSEKKLIPLHEYNPTNEIFKFQNILAINKNLNK